MGKMSDFSIEETLSVEIKPKIELIQTSKEYENMKVVDSLSLSIMPGEFVSLLGPSGCGKTTTLRMIAGFILPSNGTINMDGQPISRPGAAVPPEKRNMSMIFQSYAIWPNMTVGENVAFGLKLRKTQAAEIHKKVDKMLSLVRLSHLKERYPSELSGGQQQRVALARAMIIEPQVLLLDEPLSNLDASLREEMRTEIRRLHGEFKITTVYVTHDQTEAMVASDRIVVMNQGRVEQVDDPVTLYEQPKTRFVADFIGQTNCLDGIVEGDWADFNGLRIPIDLIPGETIIGEPLSCAIRFSNLIMGNRHIEDEGWRFQARVVDRYYIGELWQYVLVVNDTAILKASSKNKAYSIGDVADIFIELKDVVRIPNH